MSEYIDPHFIRALAKPPDKRNLQDLQIIYYGLHGLEALSPYRDSTLRSLCKTVRYERHDANDVLYYTGELSTCWYILISGSVFIDGSMFLPTSRYVNLELSTSKLCSSFHILVRFSFRIKLFEIYYKCNVVLM
ncbi:rap guanine nucleotide exchange factor 6-like [Nilaparvata lugens]|uniref:rap guanine nucleotide exchange factor 6-like n=1 Tax=Nilaparvata lugens TaxID=108931 RepID=UPI00193E1EA1|nr:rap guanine nucleotide exchange factor 6-like [Nilaparvata lugens]